MTSLIQYVSRILIISLPAVVVFLCFMPYRMRALKAMNLHSGWQREIGLILFVVSIFGILALTLWPTYIWEDSPGIWGDIRILIDRPAWKSSLSVVPFSVFKDYFEDLLKSPVYFFVTLINFFGNLAMFIPIGFFFRPFIPKCHIETICNHRFWNVNFYRVCTVFHYAQHRC